MKILELFSGSRSIGLAAESLFHKVYSVDIHDFDGIEHIEKDEFNKIKDDVYVPPYLDELNKYFIEL